MKQSKTYLYQTLILFGIFYCLNTPVSLYGQSTGLTNISFKIDGETISDPFTGGTLTPQYNEIDLNLDGVLDLVLYDRRGEVLTPYLYDQMSGSYHYQPEYRSIFPELSNVLYVRDYNFDGIPDLYTGDIVSSANGLVVYKGSIVDNQYSWELVTHFLEPLANIYFLRNGQFDPVYSSFVDKSEIIDIDGDGDLDILAFDSGGAEVVYYRNMTIEDERDYDEHYYIIGDECFGKFLESGTSSTIFLSEDPADCYSTQLTETPVELRHAGSTITALDQTVMEIWTC